MPSRETRAAAVLGAVSSHGQRTSGRDAGALTGNKIGRGSRIGATRAPQWPIRAAWRAPILLTPVEQRTELGIVNSEAAKDGRRGHAV